MGPLTNDLSSQGSLSHKEHWSKEYKIPWGTFEKQAGKNISRNEWPQIDFVTFSFSLSLYLIFVDMQKYDFHWNIFIYVYYALHTLTMHCVLTSLVYQLVLSVPLCSLCTCIIQTQLCNSMSDIQSSSTRGNMIDLLFNLVTTSP